MATERESGSRPMGASNSAADRTRFAEDLKQRREAARRLEQDILTEVPMLYGSCDSPDPGIVHARLHREALIGRNGGGVPPASGRSGATLPFERATIVLAVALALLLLFMN